MSELKNNVLQVVLDRVEKLEEEIEKNDDNSTYLKLADYLKELLKSLPSHEFTRHELHLRLWKKCFYDHKIQVLRNSISKMKKRVDGSKEQEENKLKVLLINCIEFYKTLINDYKKSEHYRPLKAAKDTSMDDTYKNPCIILMHNFYLRLGDLHRYNDNLNEAEKVYRQASELFPGNSDAYNQMAVISFQKELFLDALYNFTRSFTSTFPDVCLINSNKKKMTLLFQKNATFFSSNKSSSEYDTLQSATGKVQNKKKVLKLFLAEYIGVHSHFFDFSLAPNQAFDTTKIDSLRNSYTFLKHLEYLLKEEELSDKILLKMIVINIYAIVDLGNSIKTEKEKEVDNLISDIEQDQVTGTSLLSFPLIFAYRFGTLLLEQFSRYVQAWKKSGDTSGETRTNGRSLRHFMVLQLFCDWLQSQQVDKEQTESATSIEQQKFQMGVASVWNELVQVNEYAALLGKGITQPKEEIRNLKFPEHFELRGFHPFVDFVSQESPKQGFHVNSEDELQGRIYRLLLFLRSCEGFAVKKDGTFRLKSEAFGSEGESDHASHNYVCELPPDRIQNLNVPNAFHDQNKSSVLTDDLERLNSDCADCHKSSSSKSLSQIQAEEPNTPVLPLARQQTLSGVVEEKSIQNQASSTREDVCLDSSIQMPSNEAFNQFPHVFHSNPFEKPWQPPAEVSRRKKRSNRLPTEKLLELRSSQSVPWPHPDPQSTLFDFFSDLTAEESAARNILLIYGSEHLSDLDPEYANILSRKRRYIS